MTDAPDEAQTADPAPAVGGTKMRGPWYSVRAFEHASKPKSVTVNGVKLTAKEFAYAKGVLTLTPDVAPTGIVSIVVD